MVLRFFMLAVAFLLSCTDVERDDPDDPKSKYYNRGSVSSSSSENETVPSSSSSSSSGYSSQSKGIPGPSVSYEGGTYNSVVIGTQTWMSRNLNYAVPGSKCGNGSDLVDRDTKTCETYGRLYEWATAMALDAGCRTSSCASQINSKHRGICPDGWHIPSHAEWTTLERFVSPDPATKLKAEVGWNSFGAAPKGTDDFGFSALPGGWAPNYISPFQDVGNVGWWWSSSEDNSQSGWFLAYYNYIGNDHTGLEGLSDNKDYMLSVRCVKD
ncbi:MAG: hypothetical protein FWF63_02155 [Fibromonadales bacterium]|nr:hypothetical protein [Fibromonadales bacterium]